MGQTIVDLGVHAKTLTIKGSNTLIMIVSLEVGGDVPSSLTHFLKKKKKRGLQILPELIH